MSQVSPACSHGPHLSAQLITAMVTPFLADGSLDREGVARMARHLADNGSDGILVNGTTGEAPTLSIEEKIEVLTLVKQAIAGRSIQLIAGVGSNDTQKSVQEAQKIASLGVDGLLVVVPYYNKPSQRGMIVHFQRIAEAVPNTEIVIYNIPSRSVVLMSPDTMLTLHRQCPNIIGVKQSHPDMDQVSEIVAKLPGDTWRTWCGDDSLTLPMMACGAHGLISVLSHLTGPWLRRMVEAAKTGDLQTARTLHLQQFQLARDIFFLPNPIVIKTCLAELGLLAPVLRPPMCWPDETEMIKIGQIMDAYRALKPLNPAPSLASC